MARKKASRSGIHINPANKGKFTAKAKKAGKSIAGYASKVVSKSKKGKKKMSASALKTLRQAVFARNAKKWHHKGKKK